MLRNVSRERVTAKAARSVFDDNELLLFSVVVLQELGHVPGSPLGPGSPFLPGYPRGPLLQVDLPDDALLMC